MIYIKDQYGNKKTFDGSWRFTSLPTQSKTYGSSIEGYPGQIRTGSAIPKDYTASISGYIEGDTKSESDSNLRELLSYADKGLLYFGDDYLEWMIEGEIESITPNAIPNLDWHMFEVTINIKVYTPHKMSDDIIEEYMVTPESFPDSTDLSNPDNIANLSFATYKISDGSKISDANGFNEGFSYSGYTGLAYLWANISPTSDAAGGIEFDFYDGFSLRLLKRESINKIKAYVDNEYIGEFTIPTAANEWGYVYSYNLPGKHRAKIVGSFGTIFYDRIGFTKSDKQTIENHGTCIYPSQINIESYKTKYTYSVLGKIQGNANHPIQIGVGNGPNPFVITPNDSLAEFAQVDYDKVMFNNESYVGSYTGQNTHYRFIKININLMAVYSDLNVFAISEIKDNLQNIFCSIYASGGLYDSSLNLISPGLEIYMYNFDTSNWDLMIDTNQSTLDLISFTQNLNAYISSANGLVSIMLKSAYASDGTNRSGIRLNYLYSEVEHQLSVLNTDFLTNTAKNLLTSFYENWLINSKAKIISDFKVEHNNPDFVGDSSNIYIYNVKPNTKYYLSCKTNAIFRFVTFDNQNNIISIKDLTTEPYLVVTTEPNTAYARVYLRTANADSNYWENPLMVQAESGEFQPQSQTNIGFSQDQKLTSADKITLYPTKRKAHKNSTSILPQMTTDYRFSPLTLQGVNHLEFGCRGGLTKVTMTYQKKWR